MYDFLASSLDEAKLPRVGMIVCMGRYQLISQYGKTYLPQWSLFFSSYNTYDQ